MTKKEIFIGEIENHIKEGKISLSEEATTYFEALKISEPQKEKRLFTDNGLKILQFMRDNEESFNSMFQAKTIGEQLDLSARTVSGAIRKLVTDGYVSKLGDESPIVYELTDVGRTIDLTNIDEQ